MTGRGMVDLRLIYVGYPSGVREMDDGGTWEVRNVLWLLRF